MSQFDRYLDVNYLKSLDIEPQYFGLGFIQLKLNDEERLHFWIDDGIVPDDEVHDHRYDFFSTILQGRIENYQFDFEPALTGQYAKVMVSCDPEVPVPQHVAIRGHLIQSGFQELSAGSGYNMQRKRFHQTYADPHTVTHLRRGTDREKFAHVIRGHGEWGVCPFSKKMDQADIWKLIEACVNKPQPISSPVADKPGYHLEAIPKGVVGEPSKVYEETREFMDAIKQDLQVMALFELTDLIGAIDAYLVKNHPTVTLGDLIKQADVTKRVFQNGHR